MVVATTRFIILQAGGEIKGFYLVAAMSLQKTRRQATEKGELRMVVATTRFIILQAGGEIKGFLFGSGHVTAENSPAGDGKRRFLFGSGYGTTGNSLSWRREKRN